MEGYTEVRDHPDGDYACISNASMQNVTNDVKPDHILHIQTQ